MHGRICSVAVVLVGLTCGVAADSIVIDGKLYEGVHVSTTPNFYYVANPSDGSVLNVSRDKVAPSDVKLTEDPETRRALLKAWKQKKAEMEQTAPESKRAPSRPATVKPPRADEDGDQKQKPSFREAQTEFFRREHLENLVRFEAELEQWRGRPPAERERIFGDLVARLVASQGEGALAAVAAEAVRAEASLRLGNIGSQAARHAAAAQESRARQAEEVHEVWNNPSLDFYRDMLEATLIRRHAQDVTGNHNPYTNVTVEEYAGHVAVESVKAAEKAARVSGRHEAYQQAQRERLKALDQQAAAVLEQKEAAEREARRVASLASSNAFTAGTKLERIMLFEAAIERGYAPRIPLRRLGQWTGGKARETDAFTVKGKVWKIDVKLTGAGRVRVSVLNDAGRPAGFVPWRSAPYWDFAVLDSPGRYTLRIEVDGSVDYAVEACEVPE